MFGEGFTECSACYIQSGFFTWFFFLLFCGVGSNFRSFFGFQRRRFPISFYMQNISPPDPKQRNFSFTFIIYPLEFIQNVINFGQTDRQTDRQSSCQFCMSCGSLPIPRRLFDLGDQNFLIVRVDVWIDFPWLKHTRASFAYTM